MKNTSDKILLGKSLSKNKLMYAHLLHFNSILAFKLKFLL